MQLQYATIAAPIAGRTGALMVHAGNLVRANDTTPLVVINQVAPIYVSFAHSRGAAAGAEALHGAGHARASRRSRRTTTAAVASGTITFVDNAVDQTTGTIKVKGTFPNDDRRLWPGQFVNVVVTLTTDPNAIVVPTAAVQTGQQGQYVFVVKPDQTVELRPVTVARDGRRRNGHQERASQPARPSSPTASCGWSPAAASASRATSAQKAAS